MKLRNLVQTMTLSILASAMLIGCGGGSDSATPVDDTQTGTFVDAPVKGLYFKTATQQGYTNDSGEFSYKAGETVEFKLGNLSLGTVTAGELITPYTIAGDTNISDPSDKATNIAMLLQSFDGNRSDTSMLDVSKLQDANLSDINISVSVNDMTTKIANKFADNSFSQYRDITNNTPVGASTAQDAMKTYVEAKLASLTVSVATGFGAEWVDGKTLYTVVNGTIYTFKFNNGKEERVGLNFNANYSIIENGILKVDESSLNNGVETYDYVKILAIDGEKITLAEGENLNTVRSSTTVGQYFFTTLAAAQAYLALPSSTNSVATGFNAEWLKGKTLWSVADDDGTKIVLTFTFSNNNTLAYGSPLNLTVPYTVTTSGIIDTIENNDNGGHEYYKIIGIDGTKISLCEGEQINDTTQCGSNPDQWLFTNEADAIAFKNSL